MTTVASRRPVVPLTVPDGRVDELLHRVLTDAGRSAARFGGHYPRLWAELERSVRGGKRFRSALVLRTHEALGGDADDDAVLVAAGFELLHTAFLVHDDLIDHDSVRRGEPNLAATLRASAEAEGAAPSAAAQWSEAAAVLAGDLALSRAHRLVASVQVPESRRTALLDLLDETLLVSAGGELDDTAYGLGIGTPGLDDALLVCESKTAMYSFRAPLRAGAILAGASDDVVARLDDVGRLLGRAFQLVDDLLGVFAPEDVIGKSNVSDLREGKVTALVLHARGLPVWAELAPHFGQEDLDPGTAATMRRLLAHSSAPGEVVGLVQRDLEEARRVLATLPEELEPLVEAVVGQVGGALDVVVGYVEEVRCATV